MGRVSTKANKTRYQLAREELGLSREKASELLQSLTPERIEKIESERSLPHPDEVLAMAQGYRRPSLCNYYCANHCPIGQEYVPEMLASLNAVERRKVRLIEITADGRIDTPELDDFIAIQEELERISMTVEGLQLWAEKMLADGKIDLDTYRARKNSR